MKVPTSEERPAPGRRGVLIGGIYAAALGAPGIVYLLFPPKAFKADP
jgi:hypothetical protein